MCFLLVAWFCSTSILPKQVCYFVLILLHLYSLQGRSGRCWLTPQHSDKHGSSESSAPGLCSTSRLSQEHSPSLLSLQQPGFLDTGWWLAYQPCCSALLPTFASSPLTHSIRLWLAPQTHGGFLIQRHFKPSSSSIQMTLPVGLV